MNRVESTRMSDSSDIEFLKEFLKRQQSLYRTVSDMGQHEFQEAAELKTPDDCERCARLADELGFDGNLFRVLFYEEDLAISLRKSREGIKTIPRMIAVIEEGLGKVLDESSGGYVPSAEEFKVLRCLAGSAARLTQVKIEVGTNLSRKTIGIYLRRLHEMGLVDYPKGKKQGAALTEQGRAVVAAGS